MPLRVIGDIFANYIAVLLATIFGFVLVGSALLGNLILSPRQKTEGKGVTYECGMLTIGRNRTQVHFRYYLFAILFLIFDIEAVFLFPWAVTLRRHRQAGLLGDDRVHRHPGLRSAVRVEEGRAAVAVGGRDG